MIPSNKWFPGNVAARTAWFENFTNEFSALGAGLGFSPAEVAAVEDDNKIMQFLGATTVWIKAYDDAVRQYRIIITENEIGDPTPQFPANPALALPVVVPTGIFERLNDLVERIRVAPTYTKEIGAMLGIIPAQPTPPDPNSIKPTITASPSFAGYKFDVNVTRMKMNGFKIQIRRMDSEVWTDAGFGTSSPLEITVAPTAPGQPERLQVRVILLKKNEPVGQPSDPVYVTVNP